MASFYLCSTQVGSPTVRLRLGRCTAWVKRWSEAESFTIFENHVYTSKKNLMFAQKFVQTPFLVGFFFLYYTSKSLHKILYELHFWQDFFFLYYTSKSLHKILYQLHFWQDFFLSYATQVKVCTKFCMNSIFGRIFFLILHK